MRYKLEISDFKDWKKKNPEESTYTVPDKIISIENWALADSPQLKKIILPSKLTELGYKAFENSNNIEEICFPNGEKKSQGGKYLITNGYLYDVFNKVVLKVFSNSEVIEIPEGVLYLDRLCFAGRTKLKKVVIPASVKSMEVPFEACNSISEIVVAKDNEKYAVSDNCLYEKAQGILERVITAEKEFIVPDFIKEIRASSFPECVEKIQLPNGIKTINASAGESPLLKEWIKKWRKKQQELRNEIKHVVDFSFSLSNCISDAWLIDVSRNENEVYKGRVYFKKDFAIKVADELEKILCSSRNYSLIHFEQPEKKDLIFVIENYGDKFSKIQSGLRERLEKPLLLVTVLYPDENGAYLEFVRMTEKINFIKKFYNLIAEKMPEVKSNLIESVLEMNDLEEYYERIE